MIPSGGLAGADSLCQAEATNAGIEGVFRAALATNTTTITSRFDLTGLPWARLDGTIVVTGDPLTQTLQMLSPLNQHADGSLHFPFMLASELRIGDQSQLTLAPTGRHSQMAIRNLD